MYKTITAIYENGVLRPVMPLELSEHAEVQVLLNVPGSEELAYHRDQVKKALVAAGLMLPVQEAPVSAGEPSAERLHELAVRFGADRPPAELISEDREGHC